MSSYSKQGNTAYWSLLTEGWFTTHDRVLYRVVAVDGGQWTATRIDLNATPPATVAPIGARFEMRELAANACLEHAGHPDARHAFQIADTRSPDCETRDEEARRDHARALLWGEWQRLDEPERRFLKALEDAWAHDGWTACAMRPAPDGNHAIVTLARLKRPSRD